jgi:hypothetical protein
MDLQYYIEQVEEQLNEYSHRQTQKLIRGRDLSLEQLYETRGRVQAAEELRGVLLILMKQ